MVETRPKTSIEDMDRNNLLLLYNDAAFLLKTSMSTEKFIERLKSGEALEDIIGKGNLVLLGAHDVYGLEKLFLRKKFLMRYINI